MGVGYGVSGVVTRLLNPTPDTRHPHLISHTPSPTPYTLVYGGTTQTSLFC